MKATMDTPQKYDDEKTYTLSIQLSGKARNHLEFLRVYFDFETEVHPIRHLIWDKFAEITMKELEESE